MNMEKHIATATIAFIICLFTSCGRNGEKVRSDARGQAMSMSETYVDTMTLTMSPFKRQVVCNGRLKAVKKSDLMFPYQGITMELFVKEGQWVKKGDLIATLDKRERQRNLEKAEHDLFKADVDLTDKLIGLGFGEDRSEVPEELLKRAEVTSGYYDARFRAEEAQEALENCDLVAPFSGRVANIEAQAHQRNEKVCTLIDDSAFDVEFKVLEDELINIKKGQSVKISPFIDEESTFQGTVAAINPQVDEKGLVKITATLAGGFQSLIDGMNVRDVAEEHLGKMYVVPKDAVVERDGYHVIFRYRAGHAVWTYVDVAHSNINSFAITGCKRKETTIEEGDIVITSGNLNLADGTEVKPR